MVSPRACGVPHPDAGDEASIALRGAATAPELWRRLLLFDTLTPSSDLGDAEDALRRLHSDGQPRAATTALVLLTSWRWRRRRDQLLRRLLATGVMDDADLDEIAEVGLLRDEVLFVLPAAVFSGVPIVLPVPDEAAPNPVEPDLVDLREVLPVRVGRPLAPPLRRWAAGHLLQRDPHRLDEIRQRIRCLGARDAAAAMGGVLDAIEVLTSEQADEVVRDALDWPHKSVRSRALRLLATGGHPDEAVARAQRDPDASIRAAAPQLLTPPTPAGPATLF
jgi:hypothetical protein